MQCRSENPGFPEFSKEFCDFLLGHRFPQPFGSDAHKTDSSFSQIHKQVSAEARCTPHFRIPSALRTASPEACSTLCVISDRFSPCHCG